jgi:hypothetical protein
VATPETFEQRKARLDRERAIRYDAVRQVVSLLCRNARTAEKIGTRALILNHSINSKLGFSESSQRELAIALNLSPTCLCERLANMESALQEITNLGVSDNSPKTLVNFNHE